MASVSKKSYYLCVAALFSFLLLTSLNLSAAPLVISTLNASPNNEIKRLLPFSNYIAERLLVKEVDKSKVRVEKNIVKIGQLLQEDKIDIYIGNPFTSIALNRLSGMRFLLQAVSQGSEKNPSIIFVRNNSAVKKAKDLSGKKIAFEDSLSTSGYHLPKLHLSGKGLKLNPLKKLEEDVAVGDLGYIFSKSDLNTLLWVKKGKIEAGAVDALTYGKQAKESLDQLRIIERTVALPSILVGYRSDLSPQVVTRLKYVLKQMHETDEGKAILKDLGDINKFIDLPPKALDPLLKANKYLNAELNF